MIFSNDFVKSIALYMNNKNKFAFEVKIKREHQDLSSVTKSFELPFNGEIQYAPFLENNLKKFFEIRPQRTGLSEGTLMKLIEERLVKTKPEMLL